MAVLPTPGSPTSRALFFFAAAQNLREPFDFFVATYDGVELACGSEVCEVFPKHVQGWCWCLVKLRGRLGSATEVLLGCV